MKLLVLLAVLAAVWLIWRNGRVRDVRAQSASRSAASKAAPQDMVRCPVCSIHLPRADALPGPGGPLYCCEEHRRSAGG